MHIFADGENMVCICAAEFPDLQCGLDAACLCNLRTDLLVGSQLPDSLAAGSSCVGTALPSRQCLQKCQVQAVLCQRFAVLKRSAVKTSLL